MNLSHLMAGALTWQQTGWSFGTKPHKKEKGARETQTKTSLQVSVLEQKGHLAHKIKKIATILEKTQLPQPRDSQESSITQKWPSEE